MRQEILYTSTKEEWLNSKDEIQKTDQDKVTVEVSKTNVVINHNDDPNDQMKGEIKNADCNWTEAFKNGKTTIHAELVEGNNDVHDATLTIEGKDGEMFILLELKDHPDMRIKAYVDKYEEQG
jgi:hypothetical protein